MISVYLLLDYNASNTNYKSHFTESLILQRFTNKANHNWLAPNFVFPFSIRHFQLF